MCFKVCITCELYVGFNPMPCVISQWSPDLISIVFVTTESNLGQCIFTLDDAFFLAAYRGKRFLNCVWVRLLPIGPKDHMQKRSYLTHSPYCPWRERQTLEGMGEAATQGAKILHTREDNIMPIMKAWIPWPVYVVVWYICDKLPYVRFYSFEIILLVLTDYSDKLPCAHYLIILVTLFLKMILQYSVRNFRN